MTSFDPAHRLQIGRAFSPSTPVTTQDVFFGRRHQLDKIIQIISANGQHGLLYGERGVGKTSVARVINDVFSSDRVHFVAAYYTCDSMDTFSSIWRGVLGELKLTQSEQGFGFAAPNAITTTTAADLLPNDSPSPNDIRSILEHLSANAGLVLFIDEFDRPMDLDVRQRMADTVKILADRSVPVTLMLIGVGETVSDVMRGHESVHRSLIEVQMPIMKEEELSEIVVKGMQASGMQADAEFIRKTARMSLGLPHYTHLLAQQGAYVAFDNRRLQVLASDFPAAVNNALTNASQSIRTNYHGAVTSNRETLYSQVLLACARAAKDDLGTFGATDVRDQLRRITKREYEIPAFAHHLNDFSGTTPPRGGILVKRGSVRRFRYKFADPLMPPYVLMMGHATPS